MWVFFTEEEIWVIFALWQGSTEAKLGEITGQVSRLYEHRTRSSCFTHARCCMIGFGHPGDYGGGGYLTGLAPSGLGAWAKGSKAALYWLMQSLEQRLVSAWFGHCKTS